MDVTNAVLMSFSLCGSQINNSLVIKMKQKLILIACTLIFSSCQSNRKVNIYDGFENSSLSKIWRTTKIVPGTFEIESSTIRAGKKAVKITLHHGDQIDEEKGSVLERSELMESRKLWSYDGLSYSYSFSIFIPKDFPIVPTRLVIAQWKQRCPTETCVPENPVIAIRYINGELMVTHKVSQEQEKVLYQTTEDIRNKWLDFKFLIRFSRQPDGRIIAWLNDQKIIDYQGINAYPKAGGYPDKNRFYFKMGLYRDQMAEPMTIYIDEYSKQLLKGDKF